MGTARSIESKALKLPAKDRARIAERLICSLDGVADLESDDEWAREAERRLADLRSGKVKGRSAATVFRSARTALR